jgi:hypothetical protein
MLSPVFGRVNRAIRAAWQPAPIPHAKQIPPAGIIEFVNWLYHSSFMLQKLNLATALLFIFGIGFAQPAADTAAIKKQLESIRQRDQKTRTGSDSTQFVAYIDSCNLVQVELLIAQYGWPGKSFVGAQGNVTVFLVIQHADLPVQEKYLPLLEKSVADSESRPCDLALLQDRVLMRQGKKQMYGSQVVPNPHTGAMEIYPIEDEKNVNIRRQRMGLEPLEEYAAYFGITYTLPAD